MITCKSCGKENQDHFKFCIYCSVDLVSQGSAAAEPAVAPAAALPAPGFASGPAPLPPLGGAVPAPAPIVRASPGSPTAARPVAGTSSPAAEALGASTGVPPAPAPPNRPVLAAQAISRNRTCPTCGNEVPPEFGFCGQCGARMAPGAGTSSPPSAPAGGGVARTMFMGRVATPQRQAARGRMVLIRPDGSEGGTHPLQDGENLVGRLAGPLFENDSYLSPNHAVIVLNAGGLAIQDVGSLNGVFLKMTEEEEIQSGDVFRVGQELLRFDAIPPPGPLDDGTEVMGSPNPGFWGRLSIIIGKDVDGSAFPLFGDAVLLGRERGDILFPEDGYVSGLHARLANKEGRFFLSDLGSSNGTFVRLTGERGLPSGSFVLLGQQLFKILYS